MSETLNYSLRPIILIVDDTPENITLINGLLKDIYRMRVAISGERALKAAVQEPRPDLILLDIMMPDLSGYEVAEQLKRDPRTAHIPIIFITAMATMEDEILGLQMGAVDYITKPINPPIVLARVEAYAAKNDPLTSTIDGVMMGLGLVWVLGLLGAMRELIGAGTLFAGIEMIIPGASAISVFGDDYAGFLIAILPPGAFFALGMLIAAFNAINVRLAARARRQPPPATAHKAPEEQADTEPAAAS